MTIDEAREILQQQRGSMRSAQLIDIIDYFGFSARPTRRGDHYVVTHANLARFRTWSFNGNHRDPVPNNYLSKFRNILNEYREELEELGYA